MHKIHGACGKVYDLVPKDLSGLVNFSLSFRMSASMAKVRRHLRSLFRDRLRVYQGSPSADAQTYRDGMLSMFTSSRSHASPHHVRIDDDFYLGQERASGRQNHRRFVVLKLLLNGDWRERHEIQHYVLPGGFRQRSAIIKQFCKYVVPALASAAFKLFPRNRWMNSLDSLDNVSIFLCAHGLLFAVWEAFAGLSKPFNFLAIDATEPADASIVDFDEAHAEVENAAPADVAPASIGASSCSFFYLENESIKTDCTSFLLSNPLPRLIMIRRILGPMKDLLVAHFKLASGSWDAEQQRRELEAQKRSESGGSDVREYRVSIAHEGGATRACLRQLSQAFAGDRDGVWRLLDLHVRGSADPLLLLLAFRLTSRAGAAIFQLLQVRHRNYPYKTFSLLSGRQFAEDIARESPCPFDDWTFGLVSECGRNPEALLSEEVMLRLHVRASILRLDISHIECRHASLRRQLAVSSTQTWAADLAFSSSLRIAKAVRRGLVSMGAGTGASDSKPLGRHRRTRSQEQSGGPWRAYVHVHSQGKFLSRDDVSELARSYRAMSPEEKHRMIAVGRLAKRARSAGNLHPFGKRCRMRSGESMALEDAEKASGLLALPGGSDVSAIVLEAGASAMDLVDLALQEGRRRRKIALAVARQALGLQAESQRSFEAQSAVGAVAPFPDLKAHGEHLQVQPLPFRENAIAWHAAAAQKIVLRASKGHSGFGAACKNLWEERHQVINQESCRAIPQASPARQNLTCHQAGTCLCCKRGKMIGKLKKRWDKASSNIWRVKSRARALASNGFFVCRLQGVLDAANMARFSGTSAASCCTVVWLHVALMYFSPWRPTFLKMEVCDTSCEISGASGGLIWLKAGHRQDGTADWASVWDIFASLGLDLVWTVDFFVLSSARLVEQGMTLIVAVEEAESNVRSVLWSGAVQEQRQGGGRGVGVRRPWRTPGVRGASRPGAPRCPASNIEPESLEPHPDDNAGGEDNGGDAQGDSDNSSTSRAAKTDDAGDSDDIFKEFDEISGPLENIGGVLEFAVDDIEVCGGKNDGAASHVSSVSHASSSSTESKSDSEYAASGTHEVVECASDGSSVTVLSYRDLPDSDDSSGEVARARGGPLMQWDLEGYGFIRYNPRANNFAAHCLCPRHCVGPDAAHMADDSAVHAEEVGRGGRGRGPGRRRGRGPGRGHAAVVCPECRKTRACTRNDRFPAQGRPPGFLAAWLVQGPAHESRVDHRDHGWPSRPDRIAARNRLKALPGAAELFSRVAERRDGEASEPEGNP